MASNKNKDNKNLARCVKCVHASLMQWNDNPIVAECKFYGERFVAECDRQCKEYEPSDYDDNRKITHFDHYKDEEDF